MKRAAIHRAHEALLRRYSTRLMSVSRRSTRATGGFGQVKVSRFVYNYTSLPVSMLVQGENGELGLSSERVKSGPQAKWGGGPAMRYMKRLKVTAVRLMLAIILLMCGMGVSSRVAAQATAPEIPTGQTLVDLIGGLYAKVATAYIKCDLDTFVSMHAPDVELYHDEVGRLVGRDAARNLAEGVCAMLKKGMQFRFEVIPGSVVVYPIPHFGAVAIQTVVVWQRGTGEPETKVGTHKEFTVWEQRDGKWMVARHIAYAHEPGNPK
jgi:ketosteroid isomerase-like protein